ncbi:hypothetical protein AOLI_G00273820 [Acnodon oligacanthus]
MQSCSSALCVLILLITAFTGGKPEGEEQTVNKGDNDGLSHGKPEGEEQTVNKGDNDGLSHGKPEGEEQTVNKGDNDGLSHGKPEPEKKNDYKGFEDYEEQQWDYSLLACILVGAVIAINTLRSLYESEWAEAREVEERVFHDHSQLTPASAAVLVADLSLEELFEALQGMENGRAPGIDALPVEFYKAFWSVLGQDVLGVLRNSFLTLLPKKRDLTELNKLAKDEEKPMHSDGSFAEYRLLTNA